MKKDKNKTGKHNPGAGGYGINNYYGEEQGFGDQRKSKGQHKQQEGPEAADEFTEGEEKPGTVYRGSGRMGAGNYGSMQGDYDDFAGKTNKRMAGKKNKGFRAKNEADDDEDYETPVRGADEED